MRSILLASSLISIVTISLLIQRNEDGRTRLINQQKQVQDKVFYPNELVCPECGELIKITDDFHSKTFVYCDQCGKEIQIPKDNVNW